MRHDLQQALAKGTHKQYKSSWKRFKSFHAIHFTSHHYAATAYQMALYVAHLHQQGLVAQTIRSNLSAITFFFNMHGLEPPTDSFHIKTLLRSYAKSDSPPRDRVPINISLLHKMIKSIKALHTDQYEKSLLASVFSLMYHSLLRVSEVSYSKDNDHNVTLAQITTHPTKNKITIRFDSFKFSTSPVPIQITNKHSDVCPVSLYKKYLIHRGDRQGPVFLHSSGKQLSRQYIKHHIDNAIDFVNGNTDNYNTHSFRLGKATDMYKQGYSDSQIQKAGRWKSAAFKKYIKPRLVRL